MIKCTTCKKDKNIDDFNFIRGTEYTKKRYSHCSDCSKIEKVCGESSRTSIGCGKLLSLDFYTCLESGTNGKNPLCADCKNKSRKQKKYARPEKGTIIKCYTCEENLDESKYDTDAVKKNGIQSSCKDCRKKMVNRNASDFNNYVTSLWQCLLGNAKNRNICVKIEKKCIYELYEKQKGMCYLCNSQMTYNGERNKNRTDMAINNISVDRVDSSKEYEKDNVKLSCYICNIMKGDLDLKEFKDLCKNIADTYNERVITKIKK